MEGEINQWHHYAAILCNIKELLRRSWQIEVRHTLREGNSAADFIVKMGAAGSTHWSQFVEAPAGVEQLLQSDAAGSLVPRM